MSIPFFQVDAFAREPLTGNPAAVMPLERWLPDALLQAIAAENNLSETAFTVPSADGEAHYDLRWFTPAAEVDLCGHATLAAGHILLRGEQVRFATRSGVLGVRRRDDLLELDLPAAQLRRTDEPQLCAALGVAPQEVWSADGFNDSVVVPLADEAAVRSVSPDFAALAQLRRMAIVTAPGETEDVASRVFVPHLGIDEDPVTGSAHGVLVPFWAERLGRTHLSAFQASRRGGWLDCVVEDGRVRLAGRCFTVIEGHFQL
jgi:PhzF family phenazine biosynthesis protein